ncbi:restriction endonuclease subunit S, partial [Thiolapillus sp.]|uniref:restriction endonuclease subunit S n=2 Tax=Thiolapillus sp. TaxID=2017437 RepID=UPI003AF429EA
PKARKFQGWKGMSGKSDKKKSLVPRLRFPEFREAGAWEVKRLGGIYRFKPTNSWSRDQLNYDSGTIKNIHYGDIHKELNSTFRIDDEVVPYVNDTLADSVKEGAFCEEGDIVLADASEDVDDIGKAIEIVNIGGQRLVSGLHTILVSRIDHRIVVGFGAYLHASSGVRKQIQQRAQGAKILGISKAQLAEVKLAYPTEAREQQKIAHCLSSLDEVIWLQAKKVQALKQHKKGLMQQLFPAEGETTPRLRFPEFREAGAWEVKRLGEIVEELQDGNWIESKDQSSVGIRLIQTGNIGVGGFIQKDNNARYISEETFKRLNCTEIFPGDCLVSRLPNPVGRACIIPAIKERMITAVDCAIVRFDKNIVVPYIFILLSQTPAYLSVAESHAFGSTRKRISRENLSKLKISIPSLPEQQKIAHCLSSLDEVIGLESHKLDALKNLKKGLMQKLFPQEVA